MHAAHKPDNLETKDMSAASITVQPLTGAIGAEIFGVNIAEDLPAETIAAIRHALVEYGVIFFRDQKLDAEQHKAFARRFGKIFIHPNHVGANPDKEIFEFTRLPGDRKIVGEEWHTDTTMMEHPPMGAILYGAEIPPYGGDTLFSSQYLAYESLSPGMQKMLKGLRAVHSDRNVAGPVVGKLFNENRTSKVRSDDSWRETINAHPVVCRHPESGREYLFVNHSYTVCFEGMTEAESRPLLEFLINQGHRPEFTCRFRWQPGSVAFWDNRATKHLAIDDAGRFVRTMRRVQIAGGPPLPAQLF
jgi:taurine dioxygenase